VSENAVGVNTPQMMRVRDRRRNSHVLVEVPRCAGVEVYLFAGPELVTAVQRYNLYSGGGVLPPEWGLGFWYRPEMHLDAEQVLALGREFRENGIPCDVLGLEPGWQTHAYSCTFAWDNSRFQHPQKFIREAADIGFHINLWEHAFTHPASPIFTPLVAHSGNFAVWDGLVPDFAGEPARKVFGDFHGKELIDIGVSGFKLDECDNSDYTEGWSFPEHSRFPSGVDGEQMHAEFGLRYQDAILKQFEQHGKPTYSLVRSSGALAAPYPFVLYSDLYDHRQFIRALINAGFSGLLWCPEVRDAASEEDLIGRLQSVVFSPLAMVNAWYIRNPPWKQIEREQNNAGHFSDGWEHLQERCKEIISWRMQLLPYLHAAFAVYQRDGMPPFRALLMDYPDDTALANVDDEYLMGDRLLIAPLFAGEADRHVALPKGEWHDLWTGTPVSGGRKFTVFRDARNIPVFVKSGSVLP
jgi:alpha-D-xyloside xylohydrolase